MLVSALKITEISLNRLICVLVNFEQQNAEIPKKKTFVPPPRFFNKEEARYLINFLRLFSYPMLGKDGDTTIICCFTLV